MHMIRTRPFNLARDLDAIFQASGRGFIDSTGSRTWAPRVDVFETDDSLIVRYELAGFSVDDLDVTLEDGVLTVKGERSLDIAEGARSHRTELARGPFSRSLRVTESFDPDAVKAAYANGLLEITLEKRSEVLPRSIEIETV